METLLSCQLESSQLYVKSDSRALGDSEDRRAESKGGSFRLSFNGIRLVDYSKGLRGEK